MPKCQCGCGNDVKKPYNKFIHGHNKIDYSKRIILKRYGNNRIEVKCSWCENHFKATPYYVANNKNYYCKRECFIAHRTKQFREINVIRNKNNNPSWNKASIEKANIKRRLYGNNKTYKKYYGKHLHRYVMEKHLGHKLSYDEVVHHKDENIFNNDVSNLEIVTHNKHMKIHIHDKKEVMPND